MKTKRSLIPLVAEEIKNPAIEYTRIPFEGTAVLPPR